MLVLSRKIRERIIINDQIVISVIRIEGQQVRLGIEAPRDVRIVREEIADVPAPTPGATYRERTWNSSAAG